MKYIVFLLCFAVLCPALPKAQASNVDYYDGSITHKNFRQYAPFKEKIETHIDYQRLHACIFFFINEKRAEKGLYPFKHLKPLEVEAWLHAQHISERNKDKKKLERLDTDFINRHNPSRKTQEQRLRLAGLTGKLPYLDPIMPSNNSCGGGQGSYQDPDKPISPRTLNRTYLELAEDCGEYVFLLHCSQACSGETIPKGYSKKYKYIGIGIALRISQEIRLTAEGGYKDYGCRLEIKQFSFLGDINASNHIKPVDTYDSFAGKHKILFIDKKEDPAYQEAARAIKNKQVAFDNFKEANRKAQPTKEELGIGVSLFNKPKYQGASQSVGVGRYRCADLRIGDNSLGSFKLEEGYKITVFDSDDFTGPYMIFTKDTDFVGWKLHNKISSLIIEKLE
ncbi:MAG: hypothetical protein JJT94_11510 [Bernardetiaceae bacterium]|nr:hypothetical protein [Bernardetiaceae bacterium]